MALTLTRPQDATSGIVKTEAVEALLRAILAEVKALRIDLRERHGRQPSSLSEGHALLLPVLAASVADKAFSAREVIQHAAVLDGELRAALDAAGLVNPRQLGKWLRRTEGRDVAGVRLERIGLDRDGIIWRMWRVSHSHTHAAYCDDDDRGA